MRRKVYLLPHSIFKKKIIRSAIFEAEFFNDYENNIENLKQPVCFILPKYLLMTDHIILWRIDLSALDQSQI